MYNTKEIEKKWQTYWEENKTFKTENDFSKPKYYTLDMFPFPSGAGLHVGHPEGMTANDIVARYKNAKGFNVLHPMGWDAFGLPAENYAIKTGTHPKITTKENIDNFRKQIKSLGFSYDWDREVDTTDPEYYKWTQWIFLKLYEKGLAYEQDLPINYCPSCKTGLANEEVLNDFSCERCGTQVEKKKIRQWVLAITKYADRLLEDVDKLDWPEGIKEMQRNWIGKSEGCEFSMKLSKNKTQKKGESPTPQGGGHNVLARISSTSSIFKNMYNVKKKVKFSGKIEGKLELEGKTINFNSENIFKHFREKSKYEFLRRKDLLGTVFENLKNLYFESENIGYFILKTTVIKVILGKQNNGNYFIKSFYEYKKYTILYKKVLEENIKKDISISVYTTRIDTVFGMTYAVLAPDHKDVEKFITPEYRDICDTYIQKSAGKSDQDRTQDDKEKTGVFTGSYVINPFNGKEVPLWIGDYVLGNYGTGAVMAVPAHDERDFEFAKKYNLEIKQSIAKEFLGLGNGKCIPNKNVKTIKTEGILAVLIDEDEKKVLCINWKNKEIGTSFITGGIEKGEKPLEASIRELKEETGYIDIEYLGKDLIRKTFNYHPLKDVNYSSLTHGLLFKLKSHEQVEISEEENKKHNIEWVEISNVKDILTFEDNKILVEQFFEKESAFTELGTLVNSGEFSGLTSKEAQSKLTEFAEKNNFGAKKVNYKLRDWLFSRQRYWGEPIPLIHLEKAELKKLPHITEEAFNELKNNIENVVNKKMKVVPLSKKEWGTHNGTTTKPSLIDSIFKNTIKVKKKRQKSFKFKEVFESKFVGDKNIKISGAYLIGHFKLKTRKEFLERIHFSQTVIYNLEKTYFINDTLGILNISGKYWIIILDKYSDGSYNLLTYYNFHSLNKKLNKAYILKRDAKKGEDTTGIVCKHSGKVRELVIDGKVFSKIRDGIYGKIVCDYRLPLELPEVEKFEPAGDGQSPLAGVDSFVNVKLADNLTGKRETNTMPQWGGSCWYYLRYMNPNNKDMLVDPEVEKYWGQVDSYVGGAEHAVLHLLYARFWHKFLFDIDVVSNDEPFYRLRNQGLITAYSYQNEKGKLIANDLVEEKEGKYFDIETGEELKTVVAKMSKSLKNVVNPDEIVEEYGADTLRLYEMYMADFKDSAPWDTKNIIGVKRFLDKVERAFNSVEAKFAEDDNQAIKILNKTIRKVEEDIENYKFNTAIASMMILANYGRPSDEKLFLEWKEKFVVILSAFAPFLSEELYSEMGNKESVFFAQWPDVDESLLIENTLKIAVQVLGKVRGTIEIGAQEDKDSVLEKARNNKDVSKWLEGKNLVKEIYVPGKIVNLVVK